MRQRHVLKAQAICFLNLPCSRDRGHNIWVLPVRQKEKVEAEEKEATAEKQQQGPQATHAGEVGGNSKGSLNPV